MTSVLHQQQANLKHPFDLDADQIKSLLIEMINLVCTTVILILKECCPTGRCM